MPKTQIEQERDAWRELAEARGELLMAHRLKSERRADAAQARIQKALDALDQLEAE